MRRLAPLALALAALAGAPGGAQAAQRCKPVVNPYPGTRYDGVDLTRIRATGVSCPTARRVARRAHRRALGLHAAGRRHPPLLLARLAGDREPARGLRPVRRRAPG